MIIYFCFESLLQALSRLVHISVHVTSLQSFPLDIS